MKDLWLHPRPDEDHSVPDNAHLPARLLVLDLDDLRRLAEGFSEASNHRLLRLAQDVDPGQHVRLA